jgi:hypothetical protein
MKRALAILLVFMAVSLTASAAKKPNIHSRSKRGGMKMSRSKSRSTKTKAHSTKRKSPKPLRRSR